MPKPQETSSVVVNTSLGMMRPATYSEITAFLRERKAQIEWEAVRNFAQQLFGERAHHVEIVTDDEYDDEHYYRVVKKVNVFDDENNALRYDLTLPYWNQVESGWTTSLLQEFENSLKEEEEQMTTLFSQEERERLLQAYAHMYVQVDNLYANEFDLPREDATFALDEPPPEEAEATLYILFEQESKRQ